MKLIIDDANLANIQRLYEYYPVDGVTTNPSILAKCCGREPFERLKEIRAFIGEDELHVQTVATQADGIVADAHRILRELGEDTFIKIPAVPEGFKAMKKLHAEGVHMTATAIYTPMQAYLAGQCGASYAAPYVNRIDNMGFNGVEVAKTIHDIFVRNGLPTQVLAASFKNSQQVLELCRYGIGAVTLMPDVFTALTQNAAIDAAIERFTADFEAATWHGATMDALGSSLHP